MEFNSSTTCQNIQENLNYLNLTVSENSLNLVPDICEIYLGSKSPETSGNRRYTLRPKRLSSNNNILNLSPCKRINRQKTPNKNLETIFEEPLLQKNGKISLQGKAKVRRLINFNDFLSKAKLKHRKSKVKRLMFLKKQDKPLQNAVTLKDLELKLAKMEILENFNMPVKEESREKILSEMNGAC